jgi:hypothetical protein
MKMTISFLPPKRKGTDRNTSLFWISVLSRNFFLTNPSMTQFITSYDNNISILNRWNICARFSNHFPKSLCTVCCTIKSPIWLVYFKLSDIMTHKHDMHKFVKLVLIKVFPFDKKVCVFVLGKKSAPMPPIAPRNKTNSNVT